MATRGEKLAQQRFFEAEADVEVKHWEKRNSDIAFHVINRDSESQRCQQHQASRWADQAQRVRSIRSSSPNDYSYNRRVKGTDQAQRDNISLYGELEMKNRLFRESETKDCQQLEELRRTC